MIKIYSWLCLYEYVSQLAIYSKQQNRHQMNHWMIRVRGRISIALGLQRFSLWSGQMRFYDLYTDVVFNHGSFEIRHLNNLNQCSVPSSAISSCIKFFVWLFLYCLHFLPGVTVLGRFFKILFYKIHCVYNCVEWLSQSLIFEKRRMRDFTSCLSDLFGLNQLNVLYKTRLVVVSLWAHNSLPAVIL